MLKNVTSPTNKPVEKGVESFGLKIINWNVDGDDLRGHKDQTGHNQPKQSLLHFLFDFLGENCSRCTFLLLWRKLTWWRKEQTWWTPETSLQCQDWTASRSLQGSQRSLFKSKRFEVQWFPSSVCLRFHLGFQLSSFPWMDLSLSPEEEHHSYSE